MTLDQIEQCLTMHGYYRVWLGDRQEHIPFVGSRPVTQVEYRREAPLIPNDWIVLNLPLHSVRYSQRALNYLHKQVLKRLDDKGVLVPPEVLEVMRHCT